MIAWFRRRRPAQSPALVQISLEDLLVARWWGYTIDQWNALPALVKADKREQIVYAQRFQP